MLLCLSANHHGASFELLEKLSVGGSEVASRLVESTDFLDGAVVLATCNRFEAYLDVDDTMREADALGAVIETVAAHAGVDTVELASSAEALSGDAVVHHLFSVSAGLKSVVIGEDEIAGQVRRALGSARSNGTSTSSLERLFQKASSTSRGVKTRTEIGRAGRSLVRLALDLSSSRIADWSATRVLLIGTGEYAATTVAALRDRGAADIAVYSPSGRAGAFAARLGLRAVTQLSTALNASDIVVTCTSRPEPVVTADLLLPGRRLIVDLGLPRNVDPLVASVPGVELLDLETVRLHAPLEQLNATSDAHGIVDAAAAEFRAREAEREAAPAIAALRGRVFGVLDSEIERMRRRGTWSAASEADLRHLVGVLLHTPSLRAREAARAGDADAVIAAVELLLGPVENAPEAVADSSEQVEGLAG
ncbi:glutamyl-tRNA reductase [Homoserinimonas aerilata]|uniref:Glutamyl-tRNA reductase n=1 Tax=Homoserinimonas aerilata TaxID=1162970 RepID=A0A542YJ09_9MICO|nr:glutamyl-tRNA reductase [Homoserinimonas aerilata]TQL48068.1 glutamyl-tRNA reductase [Homoserinimonas aerilata]